VKNARDSVRQILSVLNCSSRGKKRRHDEPRSGAGNHSLLPPWHRRMACGGGPGPQPLRHQSAHPRGQRAPHRRVHRGRYSLVEAHPRLPAGVCANRQGIRRQRQVAPPLRLKSRGPRIKTTGSRPRKTSGSPRDCGARLSTFFFSHLPFPGCILHYFFQAISYVCLCTHVRFI
jgi:hypothetical protein